MRPLGGKEEEPVFTQGLVMPVMMWSALPVLPHVILTAELRGKCQYPHFTGEEIEAHSN